jgi:thioredoxin-related protein
MRSAKEMVKHDGCNKFVLIGSISFEEFAFVKKQVEKLGSLPGHIDDKNYWDHVVVLESLRRDRPSVFTRFYNRYLKEA